ncbi:hypothetical protein A3Q56_01542 [Intoshia linei]|uniref:C2H2-type domain-containing protein n=1 Tax=Intoshia linei TaxID=1819745 RepID=A0A177B8X6_9BILA|nr:hypothetical protein A3Q56_01542 [Intoshia linei]
METTEENLNVEISNDVVTEDVMNSENSETILIETTDGLKAIQIPDRNAIIEFDGSHYRLNNEGNLEQIDANLEGLTSTDQTLEEYMPSNEDAVHKLEDTKALHVCHVCNFSCNYLFLLKRHIANHKVVRIRKCLECNFLTIHDSVYFHHKTSHYKSTDKVCCNICETFSSFNPCVLSIHKSKCVNLRKNKAKSKNGKLGCNICPETFKKMSDTTAHLLEDHNAGRYKCNTCSEKFRFKLSLFKHVNNQHMGGLTCAICRAIFYDKESFDMHDLYHKSNVKRYVCIYCKSYRVNMFSSRYILSQHILLVHDIVQEICIVCDVKVSSIDIFYAHLTTHKESEKLTCSALADKKLSELKIKPHQSPFIKVDTRNNTFGAIDLIQDTNVYDRININSLSPNMIKYPRAFLGCFNFADSGNGYKRVRNNKYGNTIRRTRSYKKTKYSPRSSIDVGSNEGPRSLSGNLDLQDGQSINGWVGKTSVYNQYLMNPESLTATLRYGQVSHNGLNNFISQNRYVDVTSNDASKLRSPGSNQYGTFDQSTNFLNKGRSRSNLVMPTIDLDTSLNARRQKPCDVKKPFDYYWWCNSSTESGIPVPVKTFEVEIFWDDLNCDPEIHVDIDKEESNELYDFSDMIEISKKLSDECNDVPSNFKHNYLSCNVGEILGGPSPPNDEWDKSISYNNFKSFVVNSTDTDRSVIQGKNSYSRNTQYVILYTTPATLQKDIQHALKTTLSPGESQKQCSYYRVTNNKKTSNDIYSSQALQNIIKLLNDNKDTIKSNGSKSYNQSVISSGNISIFLSHAHNVTSQKKMNGNTYANYSAPMGDILPTAQLNGGNEAVNNWEFSIDTSLSNNDSNPVYMNDSNTSATSWSNSIKEFNTKENVVNESGGVSIENSNVTLANGEESSDFALDLQGSNIPAGIYMICNQDESAGIQLLPLEVNQNGTPIVPEGYSGEIIQISDQGDENNNNNSENPTTNPEVNNGSIPEIGEAISDEFQSEIDQTDNKSNIVDSDK